MEGDVLRGVPCCCGDRKSGEQAIGIGCGPLKDLHTAHGAAGDAKQHVDAKMIDQQRLRPHHVGDRDDRKVEPVRLASFRVDGGGAGRAHAAAKDVRTNDEKSIGVERAAGTNHCLPPPRPAGDRMQVADMLVAGQGVADEKGIGFRRVERAVGLIGDRERRQHRAGIHPQRRTGTQP